MSERPSSFSLQPVRATCSSQFRECSLVSENARTIRRVVAGRLGAIDEFGEAEVQNLDPSVARRHHIGRFQIAVDDASPMGRGEASAIESHTSDASAGRKPETGITWSSVCPSMYSITMRSTPSSD